MMKRLATLSLFAAAIAAANAGFAATTPIGFNVTPAIGKPFVGGSSSFDFTDWSYDDSTVTNNAGSQRTWTIPMEIFTTGLAAQAWTMVGGGVEVAAGSTRTCVQMVVNTQTGGRHSVGPTNCTSSTSKTFVQAGTIAITVGGDTAYVNVFAGANGGKAIQLGYTLF